jgi:hypothetical protein
MRPGPMWLAFCGALLIFGCGGCGRGNALLVGRTAASGGSPGTATSAGTSAGAGNTSTSGTSTSGGTTGGGIVIGSACDANAVPLTCETVGLYCRPDNPAGGVYTGTCQLPIPGVECLLEVGCAAGAGCTSKIFNIPVCIQLCSVSTDCIDPSTVCAYGDLPEYQGGCAWNRCDTDFASCDAQGKSDGTCYPVEYLSYCYQSGSVANDQPCTGGRVDGGTDHLCMGGSLCVYNGELLGTGGFGPAACYSACDVFGAGPGCDAGFLCRALGGGNLGACVQTCTTTCPAPLSCQSFGGEMLCAPM